MIAAYLSRSKIFSCWKWQCVFNRYFTGKNTNFLFACNQTRNWNWKCTRVHTLPKPSNIPSGFIWLSGSIYSKFMRFFASIFLPGFLMWQYPILFVSEQRKVTGNCKHTKEWTLFLGVFWLHSEAMWWMVMSQRAHNLLNCVNVKAPTQRIFMIVVKINDLCYCVQFPCFPCLPDIEAGLSEPGGGGGPCTPQFWHIS